RARNLTIYHIFHIFRFDATQRSVQEDCEIWERECLVCCTATTVAHLGIDVCRACAVFYRRAEKGNTYTCRTTTKKCLLGKDLCCKRCRFDNIDRLLKQSGVAPKSIPEHCDHSTAEPSPSSQSSSPMACSASSRTLTPILERLRTHYRSMCRERLNSELHSRPDPPHPLEISIEAGPFFPATCVSMNLSNRILLTALLEFSGNVFPEFVQLERKERWEIVVHMFYRFRMFEGIYRAFIVFPDDNSRFFGGFTTWISASMDNFYGDAPTGDKACAKEYMNQYALRRRELHAARDLMRRVNPCHEEFLFVVAIMFWTFGDMPVREEITRLGEKYHTAIMRELHSFYREQKGLDEYATRLGELLLFLNVFDRTQDIKEHFEMLRLLDILPEDSFTYQLQRV
ncbi:hypothetical protein PMAYCL1PPCAC_17120, partial [Pristionchus mayeri]